MRRVGILSEKGLAKKSHDARGGGAGEGRVDDEIGSIQGRLVEVEDNNRLYL